MANYFNFPWEMVTQAQEAKNERQRRMMEMFGQSLAGIGQNVGQGLQQRGQEQARQQLGRALNPEGMGPATVEGRTGPAAPVDMQAVDSLFSKVYPGQVNPFMKEKAESMFRPPEKDAPMAPVWISQDMKSASMIEKPGFTKQMVPPGILSQFMDKGQTPRDEARDKYRLRNYVLDMEARDPTIKEIKKKTLSFAAITKLIPLVNSGNTVAFNGLGTQTARAMGEVGVLTEEDVVRYVRSNMISQKAGDTLLTWIRGKPTKATMEEIADISKAMQSAWMEKAEPVYDMYVDRYSAIENMSPEEFRKKVGMPAKATTLATPETAGKATMRFNPATGQLEKM